MLALLTTDIGRGHSAHLDGVAAALSRSFPNTPFERATVFEISRGAPFFAWHGARLAYHLAGRGGVFGDLYGRARSGARYRETSLAARLLGADLRQWARAFDRVLVDHPLLVAALGEATEVWYQHGELAAPFETATDARRVFVPTAETADALAANGNPRERISVTGLCVEPPMVDLAQGALLARRARLSSGGPLTIAFFSSGAEPPAHVAALAEGARSVAQRGHRALVFARRGGRLERSVARATSSTLERVRFAGRSDLDDATAAHFPSFDAFATPPHERSSWALGLGLPAFLVGPDIGTFAPLNRACLLRAGVAVELAGPEVPGLGARIAALREGGELDAMARRGWGPAIDGHAQVARALAERIGERAAIY